MKRSDVEELINDHFDKIGQAVYFSTRRTSIFYGGYDGEVFIVDDFGHEVLNLLERIGMVPPIIENRSWLTSDPETGQQTYAVHEWESEDEEK